MSRWTATQIPSLKGKTAIITGANSGLGYQTALELARKGAAVILACRSRDKTLAAIDSLRAEVPAAELAFMALDLADQVSIAAFAKDFAAGHQRLDVLFNNAGVMALPLVRTKQGFEMQIGTNHLGHFALTAQLLPLLEATPGARVVTTSSLMHLYTTGMDLADLNWQQKRYRKWDAYAKSKLANLLFAYELQRRLSAKGSAVLSLAAHPGYAATNLQTAGPDMAKSSVGKLFMQVGNAIFAQPAAMGAWPQLYAATLPDAAPGGFYGPDAMGGSRGHPKRVRSNRNSHDLASASALWALSEQLTGIRCLSA